MGRNECDDYIISLIENWLKSKLKRDITNYNQNLVNLGIQSLDIMELASLLRREGLKIKFSQLIEHPTLNHWIETIKCIKIKKSNRDSKKENIKIDNGEFELTDVQRAYLIGREDDQELGGIGCHAYFEFSGKNIDTDRLNDSWYKVQMRHPMLRAVFTNGGKQWFMSRPYKENIEITNLEKCSDKEVSEILKKYRDNVSHIKRNVTKGEVSNLSVFILPQNKMKIILDIDLLVADVLSISMIINELSEIYMGKELLSNEVYTFKDYIENLEMDEYSLNESKKFWIDKIKQLKINPIQLPILKSPSEIKDVKVTRHTRKINKVVWEQVKENAKKFNTTPSLVLLTCYMIVLEKWSDQEPFYVNIPLFNRDHNNKHIKNIVADFTNLLLVEHMPKPNEKFIETLKRVQQTFIQNVSHSEYSGVNVQREIAKITGSQVNSAPVVFACNIDYELESELTRNTLGDMTYMISQTPGVWLDFQTYVKDGELLICWDKVDDLLSDDVVTDMLNDFCSLFESLNSISNWNKISGIFKEKNYSSELKIETHTEKLYDGFLKNVKCYPDNIALIDTDTKMEITYKKLYDLSMALAKILVEKNVNKGDYISVFLPRGYKQVVAILGIQFAGAAYVPIGIHQPPNRREKIYNQIGIDIIISDIKCIEENRLILDDKFIIDIDSIGKEKLPKIVNVEPDTTAYVIMTSGTTGIPKGVEISHNNAINTIRYINEKWNIKKSDSLIMVSSIEFDLSVYDIFGILGTGGKLILTSEHNYKNPSEWLMMINKYNVTIWNSVPILFDMLVTYAEGKKEQLLLNKVFLSGDWIDIALPNRFYNISSEKSVIIGLGGATEASIWSNSVTIPRDIPNSWKSIPYGTALKGQGYKVVDKFDRECPRNVIGELHIGGIGVAKCYVGDTDLTNEKFYLDDNGIKWYRTGDNGRIWTDGTIEFLGRIDNQVKIKGHRIEIGEVETAIKQINGIDKVKVIPTAKGLSAFIIPKSKKYNIESIKSSKNSQQYLYNLDKLVIHFILNVLKSANALKVDKYTKFKDILVSMKVSCKYERIIERWLDRLVHQGYVEKAENGYKLTGLYCQMYNPIEFDGSMRDYLNTLEKYISKVLAENINPVNLFYSKEKKLSPTKLSALFPWHQVIVNTIIDKLMDLKKERIKILEFETRNIEVSREIYRSVEENVDRYDYLDTSSIYIDEYEKNIDNINFKNSYNQIEDRQYDIILAINSIHRSYNVNQTLTSLKSKLKEDGQLIVVEANTSLLIEQITVDILNAYVGKNKSKKTSNEWIELFIANCFQCDEVQNIGVEPIYSNIFYMSNSKTDQQAIRHELKQVLPGYMIPSDFTMIKQFPLNNNGKVDNEKLINLVIKNENEDSLQRNNPLNNIERKIQYIWESEFKEKIPDIHTNFYKNGGDSLIATRIATQIERTFGLNFTIKDAMESITIKSQAEKVAEMSNGAVKTNDVEFKQDAENVNKPFELTDVQHAYFIGRKKELNENNVSTHCYFEIDGKNLNLKALENSWNKLVQSHGMMRSVITDDGMQKILNEVPYYTFNIIDLTNKNNDELAISLKNIRNKLSHQVLNINQWPIFNINVSLINDENIRLHVSFDNIIFDGWSMFALLEQWNKLYNDESIEDQLTNLNFRDYVQYVNTLKMSQGYESDKLYWLNRINGFLKAPNIETGELTSSNSAVFTRRKYHFKKSEWNKLKDISKELEITPSTLLIGIYAEAIRKVSRNDNFTLNITQFNRIPIDPNINKVIGDFTTLTLLEIKHKNETKLYRRLKNIQSQLMKDLEHNKYSGVEFQREIRAHCKVKDYILMPFVFTSGLGIHALKSKNLFGEIIYNISQTPQVWIDNQVIERDEGLDVYWDSVDSQLGETNVDIMFDYFIETLQKIIDDDSILFDVKFIVKENKDEYFEPIETISNSEYKDIQEIKREDVKEILSNTVNNNISSYTSRFFEVGGDSLKAIALVNNIREKFNVEVDLSFIFTNPTIIDIANKIEELKKANEEGVI